MKILLVEDDDVLVKLLSKSLAAHHYIVDAVKDAETGWSYGSTFEYDLIVLDVILPKGDGISLCQRFRAAGYTTPILLLTAQDTSTTKVQGLDAGADDYVVKPFDLPELIARIRALLRRGSAHPFPLLAWGDLCLDPSTSQITYADRPLTLTTKEYELLELLLRESQQVLSAEEILDRLWSAAEFPAEATVRSHIRRIRRKLVAAGAPPDLIATIHGRGYYLKALGTDGADPMTAVAHPANIAYTPPADAQQQYLAFLHQTWESTRLQSLQQITALQQIILASPIDRVTAQHQQAQHIAHKLAGTLGIFGLTPAVEVCRQLERHLDPHAPRLQPDTPGLTALVTELQHTIEQTITLSSNTLPGQPPLQMLMVNLEAELAQSLTLIAAEHGIRTEGVTLGEQDTAGQQLCQLTTAVPDMILLRIISAGSLTPVMPQLAQQYPTVPIVGLCDRSDLADRLSSVRQGSQLFLTSAMTPQRIITCIKQFLHRSPRSARVILVDDDPQWLSTLSTLLQPWKFEVTTLAEPQHFWTLLQTVTPDVVVLDALMPQMSGFELCQVIRSDPYWQRLPVLFLSALTDAHSQNQAFTAGADDFLCKPIAGIDLAHRILQRLRRVRTLAAD